MNDVEQLIQMLHSITEYDVIDCGDDENGNSCYAIRNLSAKPAMLLLNKLDINMFPEWKGKSNN